MSVNQPNLPPPIHIWEEDEYEYDYTTPLPSYIINVPSAPKKQGQQERDKNPKRSLFFPRK
jgi:hypothetical protein